MNWIEEVQDKLKRKNRILFAKDSAFLQDLAFLIEEQNHRVLALWAFELAEEAVRKLENSYPEDARPRDALEASKLWAFGKIKMPAAKREILNCHALAKEIHSAEDAALCHAVGQACSVVHTAGHAMGFPIYELTAMVHAYGADACVHPVERRKQEYLDKLLYWSCHERKTSHPWAAFMLR